MNIPSLQIEAKRLPTIFFVIELDAGLLGGQCHEIAWDRHEVGYIWILVGVIPIHPNSNLQNYFWSLKFSLRRTRFP